MAGNPYVKVQTDDSILNRIQSQIASAFDSVSGFSDSVISVQIDTGNKYKLNQSGVFYMVNTVSLGLASIVLLIPDAASFKSQSMVIKKTDTSSNSLVFTPTAVNKSNGSIIPQTIEGASTLTVSSSLSSTVIFSDGLNWWVN